MRLKGACILLGAIILSLSVASCGDEYYGTEVNLEYKDLPIDELEKNPSTTNVLEFSKDEHGDIPQYESYSEFYKNYNDTYEELFDLSYDNFLNQFDAIKVTYHSKGENSREYKYQYIYEPKTKNKYYYESFGNPKEDESYFITETKAIFKTDQYVITTDMQLNKYPFEYNYEGEGYQCATGGAKFTSTLNDEHDYYFKKEIHDFCLNKVVYCSYTREGNYSIFYSNDFSYLYSSFEGDNDQKACLVKEDGLTKWLYCGFGTPKNDYIELKVEYLNYTLINDQIDLSEYRKCDFNNLFEESIFSKYSFGFTLHVPYEQVGKIFSFDMHLSNLLIENSSIRKCFKISKEYD